jgi:hypothetical protein
MDLRLEVIVKNRPDELESISKLIREGWVFVTIEEPENLTTVMKQSSIKNYKITLFRSL